MPVNYSEIARKTLVDHLGDTGEDIFSRVIVKKVEAELYVKARDHLKTAISKKRINEEIVTFLGKFPNPEKKDIYDFINFVRMSKSDYTEEDIQERIEKTRLLLKFQEQKATLEKPSELDQFISYIRSNSDRTSISDLLQKQGLGYLIKDEKGVSDKYITEFIELVSPGEIDTK